MSRSRRAGARMMSACALAVAVSGGCAGPRPLELPGPGVDPGRTGRPPEERGTGQYEHGLAAKVVAGKEAPATLIAQDGSRCTVPEPRFREVRVGENTLCPWRTGDRAP